MKGTPGTVPPNEQHPLLTSEVAAPIVWESLAPLKADAGYVAALAEDGETLEVARVTPYARQPVRLAFSADAPYPLAQTVRTREPLFIADNEELACDHPGLVRVSSEDHACATLPLFDDQGELLGAINLAFDEPHPFTDEELELIDLVGRHCAAAMAVAQRYENELRERN